MWVLLTQTGLLTTNAYKGIAVFLVGSLVEWIFKGILIPLQKGFN